MKHPINYTPTDLPPALQQRMAQVRAARGTDTAVAYAQAVLSHMRADANAAYMRRFVGSPGLLFLRALLSTALGCALLLYFLWGSVPQPIFLTMLPLACVFTVGRAAAAYLDGGRQL